MPARPRDAVIKKTGIYTSVPVLWSRAASPDRQAIPRLPQPPRPVKPDHKPYPLPGQPERVYGMVRLVHRPVTAAVLVLFLALLAVPAPAIAAGGSAAPGPLLAPPAQNLSLAEAAAAEGQATLTSLETPRTVTVLHVEGPKGVYPGARPAAEGPLWIDITLGTGFLVVLAAAAAIAAAGYVLYRKREAAGAIREQEEDRNQR